MTLKLFTSRKEAQNEMSKMIGWDNMRIERSNSYDGVRTAFCPSWVISAKQPGTTKGHPRVFLCDDGYMRQLS